MNNVIYEALLESAESTRNYTYEEYMCSSPMRDGEEMRKFFDEEE